MSHLPRFILAHAHPCFRAAPPPRAPFLGNARKCLDLQGHPGALKDGTERHGVAASQNLYSLWGHFLTQPKATVIRQGQDVLAGTGVWAGGFHQRFPWKCCVLRSR